MMIHLPMTLNEYQRQFIVSHISTLRMRVAESETQVEENEKDGNARLEYYYIGRRQVFKHELEMWEFFLESVLSEDLIQPEDFNADAA